VVLPDWNIGQGALDLLRPNFENGKSSVHQSLIQVVNKSSDSAASYKTSTFAVGLQYKFLKDLTVYGQYANVKNQDVKDAAFNFAGPTLLTGSVAAGQTASTVNVGLLYSFF
jgi:predicted porin